MKANDTNTSIIAKICSEVPVRNTIVGRAFTVAPDGCYAFRGKVVIEMADSSEETARAIEKLMTPFERDWAYVNKMKMVQQYTPEDDGDTLSVSVQNEAKEIPCVVKKDACAFSKKKCRRCVRVLKQIAGCAKN